MPGNAVAALLPKGATHMFILQKCVFLDNISSRRKQKFDSLINQHSSTPALQYSNTPLVQDV